MTPMLAAWFDTPRLVEYLPGALIGVGIRRLGAMPDKLLARELRFTRIALAAALGDVAYALVAVTLVSTTQLGGQAMIFGFIAQSCVIASITIAGTGWRTWLTPTMIRAARLRDIFRFGAPITGEITLSEGARYWDKPLVLRLLGAENAGAYGMAFNLAQLPAIYVGGHIGTVMMPAIVRALPAARTPLIVRALGLTAVVLFPMAFGLSVCAPTLVAALLPPEWSQVAPLLSVLAAVSVLAPASFMLASFLGALGENGTALRIELLTVLVLVGALALLSRWGVVAASFAVGIALVVQLTASVIACRRHGLHLHGLGTPLLRVMAACMVMVTGVLLLRTITSAWQPWPPLRLVCEIALGAMLYPAALAFLGKGLLQEFLRLLSASGKVELQRATMLSPSLGAPND
jgi:PST family polysaccharide transporter